MLTFEDCYSYHSVKHGEGFLGRLDLYGKKWFFKPDREHLLISAAELRQIADRLDSLNKETHESKTR